MYNYQIDFAHYKLRDYEKMLAIKEFENQFPKIEFTVILDKGIVFSSRELLDEQQLKKLTFYSEIHCQSPETRKTNFPTNQTLIEGYRNVKPNLFNDFIPNKSRDIRYLTHSFHEYKGRFYPQLAKAFMNYAAVKKGETVLDPFCGSGTTLVESLLYGINAVGIDINPIAYMLAKAKVQSLRLTRTEFAEIKKVFQDLSSNTGWESIRIDDFETSIDVEYLTKWFPEKNLKKILFVQQHIKTLNSEISQLFSKVILSNLLRIFSFQDPTQLRIKRRSDIPGENLIQMFQKNVFEQIENLEKFKTLNSFDLDSDVQNYIGDIRTLIQNSNLKEESIDIVITSPPYATALPYVDTDRLSLFAFGYSNKSNFRTLEESLVGNREITKSKREELDKELEENFNASLLPSEIISVLKKIYWLNKNANVGFRRKNTAALLFKYFLDMYQGINQISKVLKKDKFAFFVVGNNSTIAGDQNIEIPTDDFLTLIAEKNNFRLIEKIPMTTQRGYMIHSKNSIKSESILIWRRM